MLGAAVGVLLMVVSGCGGSGSSVSAAQKLEREPLPARLQLQIGKGAQEKLRTQLHDRSLKVKAVRCADPRNGISNCELRMASKKRGKGIITVAIALEARTHAVQAQFTGTDNKRWKNGLIDQAAVRRQKQEQAARRR